MSLDNYYYDYFGDKTITMVTPITMATPITMVTAITMVYIYAL